MRGPNPDFKITRVPLPTTTEVVSAVGWYTSPVEHLAAGTKVYVIMHGHLAYRHAYVGEEQALRALHVIQRQRPVPLNYFHDQFPTKVVKDKDGEKDRGKEKENLT